MNSTIWRPITSLCQSSYTHKLGLVLSFVSRARGTVFKVRGTVTTSFEVVVVVVVEVGGGGGGGGGGGRREGANLAVLSFWLSRTFRLLNLSWFIVERSHVNKFQAAEKYLSPCWIHH